eukprot:RCo041175
MLRCFSVIVAVDSNHGIGKAEQLPWKLPGEMKHFREVTSAAKAAGKRNAVVMGRKTWESIPSKFRPLPDRVNIVVSATLKEADVGGAHVCPSLEAALQLTAMAEHSSVIETVFIIGGEKLYTDAMNRFGHLCQVLHLTRIDSDFVCDVFFPNVVDGTAQPEFFLEHASEPQRGQNSPHSYKFMTYRRTNKEEQQYLDLLGRILRQGTVKEDRTGVGTRSVFGAQMRFSLRDGLFPLLTSKRVFWRGVAEELLWFIRGDTNAKHLQEKDIHIWDGNASREYLDKIGLKDREEGDLGPVYGFQWRHFGAKYKDFHADYSAQGVDQLQQIIHTLRTNPNDRRILLSAWNPAALCEMALPPCHVLAQFYVADGELSCQMYQRSCDMGLGVPFNIASYALLTRLLAHVCGLKPGDFVHTLGDAHIYLNHVKPLEEQLLRHPRTFPTLHIRKVTTNIEQITFEDLEVLDYHPLPPIKMEMAV